MKRLTRLPWSTLPLLTLLAAVAPPPVAQAQTREVRENREEALREAVERQEAALREILETREGALQEARERQEAVLREVLELREGALQEARERQEAALQEIRLRSQALAQERRIRGEEGQRRAREMALRIRERSEGDMARRMDRIREAQQVAVRIRARARLGVSLDGSQGEDMDRKGALVKDVAKESPAEGAGLQVGDIITHLDGRSLLEAIPREEDLDFDDDTSLPVQRLMALARELEEGQEVEVRFLRDGEARTVTLEAAELDEDWVRVLPGRSGGLYRLGPEGNLRWRSFGPDEDLRVERLPHLRDLDIVIPEVDFEHFKLDTLRDWSLREGDAPNIRFFRGGAGPGVAYFRGGEDFAFGFAGARIHGLELRKLNPDLGEYFSTQRGVLVLEVDEDSGLGLRSGDVILSIGDREVEDAGDVLRILGSYEKDETVTFSVMRGGREMKVEGSTG